MLGGCALAASSSPSGDPIPWSDSREGPSQAEHRLSLDGRGPRGVRPRIEPPSSPRWWNCRPLPIARALRSEEGERRARGPPPLFGALLTSERRPARAERRTLRMLEHSAEPASRFPLFLQRFVSPRARLVLYSARSGSSPSSRWSSSRMRSCSHRASLSACWRSRSLFGPFSSSWMDS